MLGAQNSQDGIGPDSAKAETDRLPEMSHQFVEEVKQEAIESGIAQPPDTAAPDTSIVSITDGNGNILTQNDLTSSDNVTLVFSGNDNAGLSGFECSLDSAVFDSCDSPLNLMSLAKEHIHSKLRL